MKTLKAIASLGVFAASIHLQASSGPFVVGFNAARGGSYNLQSQTGLRNAVEDALSDVSFSFVSVLSDAALEDARGVIIVSPFDDLFPVAPLSVGEQQALSAFVRAGGFAIVVTDSDFIPTNFDATNDSFLAPFGFSAEGAHFSPITITTPDASPITNGPFGRVTSLSGIATGSYAGTGNTPFLALGTNPGGSIGAGYFAPGALGTGSGAVLFIADGNAVNSLWAGSGNFDLIANFVTFAAIPEPSTVGLLGVGGAALLIAAWRRRVRR